MSSCVKVLDSLELSSYDAKNRRCAASAIDWYEDFEKALNLLRKLAETPPINWSGDNPNEEES
jgi:hypothetical protein